MAWPADTTELCSALKEWRKEIDALPEPKPLISMRPADALALGPDAAVRVVAREKARGVPDKAPGRLRLLDETRAAWAGGSEPSVVEGTQGFWFAGLRLPDARWVMLCWQEPYLGREDEDPYTGWEIYAVLATDAEWARDRAAEKVERVVWDTKALTRLETLDAESRTVLEGEIVEDILDLGSGTVWFHTVCAGPVVALCSFSDSTLHVSELVTAVEYEDACESTGHELDGIDIRAPRQLMQNGTSTLQ